MVFLSLNRNHTINLKALKSGNHMAAKRNSLYFEGRLMRSPVVTGSGRRAHHVGRWWSCHPWRNHVPRLQGMWVWEAWPDLAASTRLWPLLRAVLSTTIVVVIVVMVVAVVVSSGRWRVGIRIWAGSTSGAVIGSRTNSSSWWSRGCNLLRKKKLMKTVKWLKKEAWWQCTLGKNIKILHLSFGIFGSRLHCWARTGLRWWQWWAGLRRNFGWCRRLHRCWCRSRCIKLDFRRAVLNHQLDLSFLAREGSKGAIGALVFSKAEI